MLKNSFIVLFIALAFATTSPAQNSNTSTSGTQRTERTTTTTTTTTKRPPAASATEQNADGQRRNANASTQTSSTRRRSSRAQTNSSASDPTSRGVVAAFDSLIEGIEHADVAAVTSVYWNSPDLVLFNNNGTVTRGWQQMRANRASSYPQLKDVRLAVRDMHVQMLGRDGALVSCLWTQTQTVGGTPETASGRMTLVFRRIGGMWKAVHLHTSPDAPDQSRVLPSERNTSTTTTPAPPETKSSPTP